jgi:hypothetical protein
MQLLTIQDAEKSKDLDVKMVATRASKYRQFGSKERIRDAELAVVDLRDSPEPSDFADRFLILDRHPMTAIVLVRKLS